MKLDRNRWEIFSDILKATLDEKKIKKTRILQKAYLDWRTFNRYFVFLLDERFITKHVLDENNPEECYKITEKGREFLKKLKELEDVIA